MNGLDKIGAEMEQLDPIRAQHTGLSPPGRWGIRSNSVPILMPHWTSCLTGLFSLLGAISHEMSFVRHPSAAVVSHKRSLS